MTIEYGHTSIEATKRALARGGAVDLSLAGGSEARTGQ
jgi:hypothetical protein